MIPASKHRKHKDKLQRQRSRSGADWESGLCEELDALPNAWARRWPKAWAGQPFDISAEIDGHAFAFECKSIARGNLPFSALRPNEVENLSRFEDAGGIAVIAVRRLDPPAQAFVPWYAVRPRILAGDRGSIPLAGQPQTLADVLEVSLPWS
ncbi:MAG: hypothetical protein SPH42_09160 [Gemmiger sp.]|uniref:hypothetical protein n=1 Tax=Gemmiger sp. TaxID=2049027 RepID=UPI002A91C6B3|nr:hypothetical protein [Gemmiger sp.]MDY5326995.1 hypothetical protein [Gemmiger sp.]